VKGYITPNKPYDAKEESKTPATAAKSPQEQQPAIPSRKVKKSVTWCLSVADKQEKPFMHSKSEASHTTFGEGEAAMAEDPSSEEEDSDFEDDSLPYKRFKSVEGSMRQAQRRGYGPEAIKQEKLETSISC